MTEYLFLLPISISLILGVMSPGPSFILIAQTAASKSRAEGVAASVGMGVGAAIFAIIASAGLYVVLETVPWVYLTIKVLGGLYLCFLAYKIWSSDHTSAIQKAGQTDQRRGAIHAFFIGLATQLSNPKAAIAFVGIFAAFLPAEVPSYSYIIFCLLAFTIDTTWYSMVAVLLSTKKAQQAYMKYNKYICRVAGGFIGLMGLKLISNR